MEKMRLNSITNGDFNGNIVWTGWSVWVDWTDRVRAPTDGPAASVDAHGPWEGVDFKYLGCGRETITVDRSRFFTRSIRNCWIAFICTTGWPGAVRGNQTTCSAGGSIRRARLSLWKNKNNLIFPCLRARVNNGISDRQTSKRNHLLLKASILH